MIEFLIAVVPLLLLLGSLLCHRYPGHRVAMRLVERLSRTREETAFARLEPQPSVPETHAVRGGLLIAFGLAQRPPPLAP